MILNEIGGIRNFESIHKYTDGVEKVILGSAVIKIKFLRNVEKLNKIALGRMLKTDIYQYQGGKENSDQLTLDFFKRSK